MTSGELELAGWRRTVAELYAAVRAQDDPRRAHELWRHGRDDLFRSHPQSPLPPGDPLRAAGLPYWPYDPGLRFELPLLPAQEELSLAVPTSDGVIPMDRIGCVRLPAPLDAVIDVWWLRQYAGGLLLPLRAGTAGRYPLPVDAEVVDAAERDESGADLILQHAGERACRRGERHGDDRGPPVEGDAADESEVHDVHAEIGVDDLG